MKTFRYERDCHKAVMKYLKTLKPEGKFFKVAQGMYSEAGVADISGTYRGKSLAFETKATGGKPTRLQLKFMRDHKRAGGHGGFIWAVEEAQAIIDAIDRALSGKE